MTKDEINRLKKACGEMLVEFNTDAKKALGRKLAAAFWYGASQYSSSPYVVLMLSTGRIDELVEMPNHRMLANRWNLGLRSQKAAEAFIKRLVEMGLAFHPDYDPDDIVNSGNRVFSAAEAAHLGLRIQEARQFLGDRIYSLMLGES